MLKKSLVTVFTTAALATTAHAQTPAAPAAPASPHTFTANLGVYSQYIFRGLTQTNRKPALQGGLDYSHSSGFYIGTWMTNISWLKENFSTPGITTGQYSSGGNMEIDIYGGYKSNIGKSDFTYDLGLLQYLYPGSVKSPALAYPAGVTCGAVGAVGVTCPKGDTLEGYVALGWKFVTLKYSHSLKDNTFGVPRTRSTSYIDLTADIPVGESGFTVNLHYGKQTYKGQMLGAALTNNTLFSYSDWKAGVSYNLPKDFVVGAYASGTSGANQLGYGAVPIGPYPRDISKTTGTVFLKKNFSF
jgi:uncharacterized protein (TIGR02001 family)